MIIILIVGFSTIFTFMNLANLNRDSQNVSNACDNYELVCANNIAASGVEIAISKRSSDTSWYGITNFVIDNGKLTVNVSNTKSKYPGGPDMGLTFAKEIASTGTVGKQSSTIRAVIQQTSSGVPAYMSYAILSGTDIFLNGGMTITDDGNNNWNSNIHANGSIILNGSGNMVNGFGTFSGTPSVINNNIDKATFHPNQNPNNASVYTGPVSQVAIPTFNASDYLPTATIIQPGNTIISANTSLGSKTSPVVYYVNGDLTIRKNITFTGYGVFIVTGTVKAEGNLTISGLDASQNNLSIYAGGSIQIDNQSKIYAQLYSNSNVILNGNTELHGLICAKSGIILNGSGNLIDFRPAGTNVTIGSSTGGRPKLLSYYN
jgi:hypothetical protein